METDREKTSINSLEITGDMCRYSIVVKTDIEELNRVRDELNTKSKPLRDKIRLLKKEMAYGSLNEDYFKRNLKTAKDELNEFYKQNQELVDKRDLLKNDTKEIFFEFDLKKMKPHCVNCGKELPTELIQRIYHRAEYGNFCSTC